MESKHTYITADEFWNSQPPMKNIPDALREYADMKLKESCAPEMLEALKGIELGEIVGMKQWSKIQELINKAEGGNT